MKNLMRTNCYDVANEIAIIGSCLPNMQPKAFNEIYQMTSNIYEICLEETHINMAIAKIGGMLSRVNLNKIILATVDKSPHCIQVHYIENELAKMMDLSNIEIVHYVAVNNKLIQISNDIIKKSKCLSELK